MTHRHGGSRKDLGVGFIVAGLMLLAAGAAHAQLPVIPPGTGAETDPYQISELGHLVWMGDTVADSAGKYYSMTADIDASATAGWNDNATETADLEGFKPIGAYSYPDTTSFRGIFKGGGYTIAGLVINRSGAVNSVGLFGCIGTGGQVLSLGMVGGAVTGSWDVGSLVGSNSGKVSNCYATVAVTGNQGVGGLIGDNISGTVSNCYATGEVEGVGGAGAGGLLGSQGFNGVVSNSYATGTVTSGISVGGLIADNEGMALNCYATGNVNGFWSVGGLVGSNNLGVVENCFATGVVSGIGGVGGLIGYNYLGTVENCFATGAVMGGCSYDIEGVGGLIGANCGTVSNCYASGVVVGESEVGGLIGGNYGTVENCYATGAVTGSGETVGGLVGGNFDGVVLNSYWDKHTSGRATSDGGTAETTAEMKQLATFLDWDFVTIWGINENVCYPYLRSITTDSDDDGVIDQVDMCPGTIPGVSVDADGCTPMISGDANRDGDVDGFDVAAFAACASGPQVPYVGDCNWADFDDDADVDQEDFGVMQRCLSGENILGDPGCGG